MKQIVADLQLHSRFSRAVSPKMVLPVMAEWAVKKGIDLLATGDWTHPGWFKCLEEDLTEAAPGIFKLKRQNSNLRTATISLKPVVEVRFLLSGEVSCIFSQEGKLRRVHLLCFSPSLEVCGKINVELTKRGCKLASDGRPVIGLSLKEVCEVVWGVDEQCLVIPAHAWTPWFGFYGSKGGFDSLEEGFGEYAEKVYAIETGLSSDPEMNWRIPELERRALLSFSDAHSPQKLGREVTVFEEVNKHQAISSKSHFAKASRGGQVSNYNIQVPSYSYKDTYWALAERYVGRNEGKLRISHTVEFYPEEGKYHWDGHRKCGVVQSPERTRDDQGECRVCGRPLTVGVEYRVQELALAQAKNSNLKPQSHEVSDGLILETIDKNGIKWYRHAKDETRPPFVKTMPLAEVIAEVRGVGVKTKTVEREYEKLVGSLGGEMGVMIEAEREELYEVAGEELAGAIVKVRRGEVEIDPGYDGVFGRVRAGEVVGAQKNLFD